VAPCGLPVQEPSADAAAREQRDGARRRALVIDPPRGAPPARVVDDAQIAWAQGLVETREPASGPCNVSLERMSDELVRHQSRDSGREHARTDTRLNAHGSGATARPLLHRTQNFRCNVVSRPEDEIEENLGSIQASNLDPASATIVVRDFPLDGHPNLLVETNDPSPPSALAQPSSELEPGEVVEVRLGKHPGEWQSGADGTAQVLEERIREVPCRLPVEGGADDAQQTRLDRLAGGRRNARLNAILDEDGTVTGGRQHLPQRLVGAVHTPHHEGSISGT